MYIYFYTVRALFEIFYKGWTAFQIRAHIWNNLCTFRWIIIFRYMTQLPTPTENLCTLVG